MFGCSVSNDGSVGLLLDLLVCESLIYLAILSCARDATFENTEKDTAHDGVLPTAVEKSVISGRHWQKG